METERVGGILVIGRELNTNLSWASFEKELLNRFEGRGLANLSPYEQLAALR